MTDELRLRPMADDDIEAAAGLSRKVGWPHRAEDWRLLAASATALAVDAGGALVATGMGWTLGPGHFAIGMVIVDPDRQGGGIGRRLMDALIAAAGPRALILNATDAGLPLYERLGFVRAGRVQQQQGIAAAPPPSGDAVRPMRADDAAAVSGLDRAATGLERSTILRTLAEAGEGVVVERGGHPVGFAICRRFGRGHLVGPVAAPDRAAAEAAIGHWIARHAGSFLRIDIPEETGLGTWLAAHGLAPVAPVAPMVRGAPPAPTGPARTFALIAQAIG